MQHTYLLGIVLVSAILNWVAVEKGKRTLEYFTKPATMLILIVWLVLNNGLNSGALWFTLGAAFSLVGDVLLMLPYNLFIYGMLTFLVAHLCYVAGLNFYAAEFSQAGWVYALAVTLVLGFLVWKVYARLEKGLIQKNLTSLRLPIFIYALVITLMVISALLCPLRPEWGLTPALWAIFGAVLFYISDTTLAMMNFVTPNHRDRILIMLTYHLGQLGILVGAGLTFLS